MIRWLNHLTNTRTHTDESSTDFPRCLKYFYCFQSGGVWKVQWSHLYLMWCISFVLAWSVASSIAIIEQQKFVDSSRDWRRSERRQFQQFQEPFGLNALWTHRHALHSLDFSVASPSFSVRIRTWHLYRSATWMWSSKMKDMSLDRTKDSQGLHSI